MKRRRTVIVLALALLMLCSCHTGTSDTIDGMEEASICILMSAGEDSNRRTVTGEQAVRVTQALERLKKTGERVATISDLAVTEDTPLWDLPVETGTMWVETADALYRIAPRYEQICLVDRHLGKGRVLAHDDAVIDLIDDARRYWPYDTYIGNWKNGALTLEHEYEGESAVNVTVKDMRIRFRQSMQDESKSLITLELTAKTDITVDVRLSVGYSGDVVGEDWHETLTLRAGEPQEVTMRFFVGMGYAARDIENLELRVDGTYMLVRMWDPTAQNK